MECLHTLTCNEVIKHNLNCNEVIKHNFNDIQNNSAKNILKDSSFYFVDLFLLIYFNKGFI